MKSIEELNKELQEVNERIAAAEARRNQYAASIAPLEAELAKTLAQGGDADDSAVEAAKKQAHIEDLRLKGLGDERAVLERELAAAEAMRKAELAAQRAAEVESTRAKMIKTAAKSYADLADAYAELIALGNDRNEIRQQKLAGAVSALWDLLDRYAMFDPSYSVPRIDIDAAIAQKREQLRKRYG